MKHPIATAGKAPGLKDTLLAFLTELRDTQDEAASKQIATVDFGEEITVTVELIASGGLNAIPRISLSKSGEQVKRDTIPLIESTDTSEEANEQYTVNGTGGSDKVVTDQTIEAG